MSEDHSINGLAAFLESYIQDNGLPEEDIKDLRAWQKIVADIIARKAEELPEDEQADYVRRAREQYAEDGTLEIDDNAIVSIGEDPGAYVAAWVWVADEPEDDGDDDESEEQLLRIEYVCPKCKNEWEEEWSCACDSECGKCGLKNIQAKEWEPVK